MGNEERNWFRFIWKIENYSYSWQEVNEFIESPKFEICATEGSFWCLKLYPRGIPSLRNSTGLYLKRNSTARGPVYLSVDYEISLLRSDGTPEYTASEKACVFARGHTSGFANLANREEIFQVKKSILLPNDTLTVQCRICVESIELERQIQAFAKSTISVHRDLFLWDAGEFNYVSPYEPGCFAISVKHKVKVSLKLCQDFIYVCPEIIYDDVPQMLRFRLGILDSDRSVSQFLVDKYMYNRKKQTIATLLITRSRLLERKELYLPQGRLILHCESSFNTGVTSQLEGHTYDKILLFYPSDEKEGSKQKPPPVATSCCCANNYSSMKNDFQNLYQEGTLCDFSIKVESETLQVHKAVMCARSSVFKAMLTTNMKEKEKNMVEISDLDADTVRRMVTFIYKDTADDLNLEIAKKLYFAADKYDIATLKRICSEFLKINLKMTSVKDVLTLAKAHADEDLKNVALKFLHCIMKRKKTIFK